MKQFHQRGNLAGRASPNRPWQRRTASACQCPGRRRLDDAVGTASPPASWPAQLRGSPRRTAHRPFPSMMMATCRSDLRGRMLCIAKSPGKKLRRDDEIKREPSRPGAKRRGRLRSAETWASCTTRSSSARYFKKRSRPARYSRHNVCGRLFSKPFHSSTRPASCSVSRCRLRFPSVRPQTRLSSLKSNPSGASPGRS